MKSDRMTTDPRRIGGVPCIRGLRIPVAAVVYMVADGMVTAEIVEQALHCVAESMAAS